MANGENQTDKTLSLVPSPFVFKQHIQKTQSINTLSEKLLYGWW